ncbi:hypothetical protein CEUSTIGMA_g582.t1 [Chlamydomonas eustigma]|uniref:Uncharacterized protein n=1 Tax=Chlamydomonas eustigma TaxID=1157962 RepID=A0A250WR07_9CHLO|nr:hypothetical protein CEUSTIGMA_g582.t1 [Chlamydomonas eustigma]|eukprot:GAX73129.1 hypothetical protein CEUSTIGMA_g582.t1 [Chlamydomonas eustigma]
MPKIKYSNQRDLEFKICPWQRNTKKEGHDNPPVIIEYMPVSVCAISTNELPKVKFKVAESSAQWISKRKLHSDVLTKVEDSRVNERKLQATDVVAYQTHTIENVASCSSEISREESQGPAPSRLENLNSDSHTLSSRWSLSGICQLAILPSGCMSGHLVDKRSKRGFGLMAQRARASSAYPDCTDDDELEVLKLRILDYETGDEIQAAVSKSGGDMVHITPTESWLVRKHWGEHDPDFLRAAPLTQVLFTAEELLEGPAAEAVLPKINSKLRGINAVINMGQMEIYHQRDDLDKIV